MALSLDNYKRISELAEKSDLQVNDAFAVDNSSDAASQKILYSSLRAALKTYFQLGNLGAGHYIAGNSYAGDLGLLDDQAYAMIGIINTLMADFATVQTSAAASRAYSAGDYLIYNNRLYMVTANIPQGGIISTNTNITPISVGSALVNALIALAPAYSTSASYSAGDFVTYVGNLYQCSGSTSGAWDSSKWTNVTVGSLLSGKMDKSVYDTNDNGIVDKATGDKNGNDIAETYAPLIKTTPTWTAPTFTSNRATHLSGGFFTVGKMVYVQMLIKMAVTYASGSTLEQSMIVNNNPAPAVSVAYSVVNRTSGVPVQMFSNYNEGGIRLTIVPSTYPLRANDELVITGQYIRK